MELERIVKRGHHSARVITRARILLLSDRLASDSRLSQNQIAQSVGITSRTVGRVCAQFVVKRLAAIQRAPHRRYKPRKLDGAAPGPPDRPGVFRSAGRSQPMAIAPSG